MNMQFKKPGKLIILSGLIVLSASCLKLDTAAAIGSPCMIGWPGGTGRIQAAKKMSQRYDQYRSANLNRAISLIYQRDPTATPEEIAAEINTHHKSLIRRPLTGKQIQSRMRRLAKKITAKAEAETVSAAPAVMLSAQSTKRIAHRDYELSRQPTEEVHTESETVPVRDEDGNVVLGPDGRPALQVVRTKVRTIKRPGKADANLLRRVLDADHLIAAVSGLTKERHEHEHHVSVDLDATPPPNFMMQWIEVLDRLGQRLGFDGVAEFYREAHAAGFVDAVPVEYQEVEALPEPGGNGKKPNTNGANGNGNGTR